LPLFALGGLTPGRLPEVAATGCHGAAAIRALHRKEGAAAFCAAFPEAGRRGGDAAPW
ncbi:MAG: thiamine phosphate synthase, partial [Nitrospirae bacterium]